MRWQGTARWLGGLGLAGLLLLTGCEKPPVDSAQRGYRGTGMAQVDNPRLLAADAALHAAPEVARPARVRENAPTAGATYKNVQVLGELSIGEFGRTMNAITAWVSPQQSCAYCHAEGDFASDAKYTKIVARRMIQMVRHLNTDWQGHVANTGVTCYTCHRGNPLPKQVWFRPAPAPQAGNLLFNRSGQNSPSAAVGLASLPADPFSDYLWQTGTRNNVRVSGPQALPGPHQASLVQTERTYGLMMHVSKSLGVNCTFCHNSRSFASWPESPIQRTTAWHGIRMVRDLNTDYLDPLTPHFPPVPVGRLGPSGDAAKISCATCHQGAHKPLYGAQTARYYPALWQGPLPGAAAPAASASAPAAAPDAAASAPASATPPALSASDAELMARQASAPQVVAVAPPAAAAPLPATAPPAASAVPPVAAATPPASPGDETNCVSLAAGASVVARRVAEASVHQQVTGSGRLHFHAAPDPACRMQGVFILPTEPVEADRSLAGYTLVWYRNPRTGGEASGWVRADRLQGISAEAAKALLEAGAKQAPPAVAPAPPAALAAAAPAVPKAAAPAAPGPAAAPVDPLAAEVDCLLLGDQATQAARPLGSGRTDLQVVGSGRAQFFSAPDARCRMQGVFIVPGDPVQAEREQAGYTSVWYRNPRTGGDVTGWVRSTRLSPGAQPVTAPR